MNNIIDIFPTPIYTVSLDVDSDKLIKLSYQEKEKDPKGRVFTNNGGYQTHDLHYQTYKFLFDSMSPHIKTYVEQYYEAGVSLENFWININNYKDFNSVHTHPQSVFSGVVYFKTPDKCGDLVFTNPFTWLNFMINPNKIKNHNKYNEDKYFIKVESKLLILFPSWLEHCVMPNLSHEDRISLSFNLNPIF
tara:strand:- start:30 stop:602 length:573 start_codon:yes stop_codon:yes gene_type:complete